MFIGNKIECREKLDKDSFFSCVPIGHLMKIECREKILNNIKNDNNITSQYDLGIMRMNRWWWSVTFIDKEIKNMDNTIEKLKEWVGENYKQYATGWTSERSHGNYDDCFSDGYESGTASSAYEVGCILGMDLEEPDEPEYE